MTKIGNIESTYRFYDLECIAGDTNYETILIEDKVRLNLDVSKVYWSSKLATERNRMITEFLKDGEVLCDMFCGVGPLAVKAAVKRKKLKVLFTCLQVRDHRGAGGDRGAHWHVHTGPFVVHPSRDTVGLQVHEPAQLLQVSGGLY